MSILVYWCDLSAVFYVLIFLVLWSVFKSHFYVQLCFSLFCVFLIFIIKATVSAPCEPCMSCRLVSYCFSQSVMFIYIITRQIKWMDGWMFWTGRKTPFSHRDYTLDFEYCWQAQQICSMQDCASYRVYSATLYMQFLCHYRLETEEQARQKLQLDKVAAESKIKKLEETLALNEDTSAKVLPVALIYKCTGVTC